MADVIYLVSNYGKHFDTAYCIKVSLIQIYTRTFYIYPVLL